MKKIKVLRTYNFVDAKGNDLQLNLCLVDHSEIMCGTDDVGFRWQFFGKEIPMPVRSGTLFNGFPEDVMIDWLKGNDWALCTCVDMNTGKAKVFELPKGNATTTVTTADLPPLSPTEKWYFDRVIRDLVNNGNKVGATRLYRYAHGGTLRNAVDAVNIIITE